MGNLIPWSEPLTQGSVDPLPWFHILYRFKFFYSSIFPIFPWKKISIALKKPLVFEKLEMYYNSGSLTKWWIVDSVCLWKPGFTMFNIKTFTSFIFGIFFLWIFISLQIKKSFVIFFSISYLFAQIICFLAIHNLESIFDSQILRRYRHIIKDISFLMRQLGQRRTAGRFGCRPTDGIIGLARFSMQTNPIWVIWDPS